MDTWLAIGLSISLAVLLLITIGCCCSYARKRKKDEDSIDSETMLVLDNDEKWIELKGRESSHKTVSFRDLQNTVDENSDNSIDGENGRDLPINDAPRKWQCFDSAIDDSKLSGDRKAFPSGEKRRSVKEIVESIKRKNDSGSRTSSGAATHYHPGYLTAPRQSIRNESLTRDYAKHEQSHHSSHRVLYSPLSPVNYKVATISTAPSLGPTYNVRPSFVQYDRERNGDRSSSYPRFVIPKMSVTKSPPVPSHVAPKYPEQVHNEHYLQNYFLEASVASPSTSIKGGYPRVHKQTSVIKPDAQSTPSTPHCASNPISFEQNIPVFYSTPNTPKYIKTQTSVAQQLRDTKRAALNQQDLEQSVAPSGISGKDTIPNSPYITMKAQISPIVSGPPPYNREMITTDTVIPRSSQRNSAAYLSKADRYFQHWTSHEKHVLGIDDSNTSLSLPGEPYKPLQAPTKRRTICPPRRSTKHRSKANNDLMIGSDLPVTAQMFISTSLPSTHPTNSSLQQLPLTSPPQLHRPLTQVPLLEPPPPPTLPPTPPKPPPLAPPPPPPPPPIHTSPASALDGLKHHSIRSRTPVYSPQPYRPGGSIRRHVKSPNSKVPKEQEVPNRNLMDNCPFSESLVQFRRDEGLIENSNCILTEAEFRPDETSTPQQSTTNVETKQLQDSPHSNRSAILSHLQNRRQRIMDSTMDSSQLQHDDSDFSLVESLSPIRKSNSYNTNVNQQNSDSNNSIRLKTSIILSEYEKALHGDLPKKIADNKGIQKDPDIEAVLADIRARRQSYSNIS